MSGQETTKVTQASPSSGAGHAAGHKTDVRGVFSTQEVRRVGTGTTTRKTVQKSFWFIEQHGKVIECQPLNTNYVPSGPKRKITMDELLAKFAPEPEFYLNSVYPKMQEMQRAIEQGEPATPWTPTQTMTVKNRPKVLEGSLIGALLLGVVLLL